MNDPYKAPESELREEQLNEESQTTELASRWSRLFAVLIDGFIGMIIAIPFWLLTGTWEIISAGKELPFYYTLLGGFFGFVGFVLVHYYFLNKNGQTIGKLALGIKIVDVSDSKPSINTIILKRYFPISIVSLIPVVGGILVFIDSLFIFRKDKRCVHDLIAGTKVVKN